MMSSLTSPLTDALQDGALLPFIGDNLAQTVTGLPSRADLASMLAKRHGLDETLSLGEVAQRVDGIGGRFAFTSFLQQALDSSGRAPTLFHRQIVTLVQKYQLRTIVTTAIADLLETAFLQSGIGIHRVVRDSDVAFISPNRPTLIKLYGDLQQPDSLVVTDSDHYSLLRDQSKEELLETVRQAFRLNTILFLGYDLSDPDFRFLFDQVAHRSFARTAYAVWQGLPAAEQELWRSLGVIILDREPLAVLEALVAGKDTSEAADQDLVHAGTEEVESERPGWDRAAIRKLLTEAFNDEELTNFCFDHYAVVYENFATGMTKGAKVQQLLDYCYRSNGLEVLLERVEQTNPEQYGRFVASR